MSFIINSHVYKKQIVSNGLILNIDPDNPLSYPGSGSGIKNLIDNSSHTLNGTYSKQSIGIRLTNTSTNRLSNVSRLNISSYSSIRMISVWVYIHSSPATRYLLDARSGSSGGYIYDPEYGPNWIAYYLNNGSRSTPSVANTFTTGVWKFLSVENSLSFTDDVTMFSRFSNNEGLDCTFGQILFYNKVLSQSEVSQNFDSSRSRYGL